MNVLRINPASQVGADGIPLASAGSVPGDAGVAEMEAIIDAAFQSLSSVPFLSNE